MEEKPNYLIIALIIIFAAGVAASILLTNYKQEILVCSKRNDSCVVEKTNLVNMKSSKHLIKYSDIEDVSYIKQKVEGNRYSQGYKEYLLSFTKKNNDKVAIFTKSYYETKELYRAISRVRVQMRSQEDEIILKRE